MAAAVSTQRAEKCGVGGAEAAAVKDSIKQTNLQGWVEDISTSCSLAMRPRINKARRELGQRNHALL